MSDMHFVPIPHDTEIMERTAPIWMPFVREISQRSKESFDDMLAAIAMHHVQLAMVWNETSKEAHALVGMRLARRGEQLIGEIIWLPGHGMKHWKHLLPELERYLKEQLGCAVIRPICRKGWSRLLEPQGYKTTHLMMEKAL